MKSKLFAALSVFALIFAGLIMVHPSISFAEDNAMKGPDMDQADDTADMAEGTDAAEGDAMEAMEAVDVGNKVCPVDGMPIAEGQGHKVEYKGKIYTLCSADEEAAFLKDADALISKMDTTAGQATPEEPVQP